MELPVVVVVATHGEDRLQLLVDRALSSVAKQTVQADLVLVVSDNDPLSKFLEEEDVKSCFEVDFQAKVRLIDNTRTRKHSGTGAWNSGILEALATFGEDCWVAILDDDDEWSQDHIELCLKAASGSSCQWVVSGIVRCSKRSGQKQEPLPMVSPTASEFYTTNPGIQGSNLFVQVRALLGAGLFDESLPSTTDRDLCIRLCDFLSSRSDEWFASTSRYTVMHNADADRVRVSSRGSASKIKGLKKFYYKYAARMTPTQRIEFKARASTLFNCTEEEFLGQGRGESKPQKLDAWSGDKLPLGAGTIEMLPQLPVMSHKAKRTVLFGVITSDVKRIAHLLADLSAASVAEDCDWAAFVVIFANGVDSKLLASLHDQLKDKNLQGYVLLRSNPTVKSILEHCHDGTKAIADDKLQISLARTVIQVFIYNLPSLDDAGAVAIIDDDKRLPKGWSPFKASMAGVKPNVMIGRDLRTPPNPSIFSLRTNLIDFMYSMDLYHEDNEDIRCYCLEQDHLANKFDWYYDLSSSRSDHLEMPVYKDFRIDNEDYPKQLLRDFLNGTPFSRDVIPLESGPTVQRGGCMVIINDGSGKCFDPLALQQHAPSIVLSDGALINSRRSDSFWCKQMTKRGLDVAVAENLFLYHDNRFDTVSSPSGMRRNVVQEVIGGILCREFKWRKSYKDARLLEMKVWLSRVRGILTSIRSRSYCTDELVREVISPLEHILNLDCWEDEVFSVIEKNYIRLNGYEPTPTDFAGLIPSIKQSVGDMKAIEKEWNRSRINHAHQHLVHAIGENDGISYVGIGSEGVCFRVDDFLYKVFDRNQSDLPSETVVQQLGSSYLMNNPDLPPILKRNYYPGTPYRGGHGLAIVKLLREWKSMNLYHTNLTPDNLLVTTGEEALVVVDIGRDVHHEASDYLYFEKFRAMCKRAYLCQRFGEYASNPHALKQLKQWMREDYTSLRLVGFDTFMKMVYDGEENVMGYLNRKLDLMNASCGYIVSHIQDVDILEHIKDAVAIEESQGCSRVGVVIENPFHHNDGNGKTRCPLWFYRRHLHRMCRQFGCFLEEDDITLGDPETFENYVAFHIFVLDFRKKATPSERECIMMLKSCPLEYQTILSDVRRTVQSIEATARFKSIVLVADHSKVNGFLRQYNTSVDLIAYKAALKQIEEERLVDHIVNFDGKDSSEVVKLNKTWLGLDSKSTHSAQGQHYASTFIGFEFIRNLDCYSISDTVLQLDSDIIIHCERDCNGIAQSVGKFDDSELVSFAFPTLSSQPSSAGMKCLNKDGNPFRFEIRCSFVNIDRMMSMLPLKIPEEELSTDDGQGLKRGWWRILDYNIKAHGLKSGRGGVGNGKNVFFVHPPNKFKEAGSIDKLGLISDIMSSNQVSFLETKSPWKMQLNQVNLQSVGKEWLHARDESIVVAIDLSNVAYGAALQSLESMKRMKRGKFFENCGVILFDNGSTNCRDITAALFQKAKSMFDGKHLTSIAWCKELTSSNLQLAIRSMCTNPNTLVFMSNGRDFDLHSSVCLLPHKQLQFCCDCMSYYDQACECLDDSPCKLFNGTPSTPLPCSVEETNIELNMTEFFASEPMTEGDLKIELAVLVSGFKLLRDAESVCVRIHSECLTGDVFYSSKCDCGLEKLQFMRIMAQEQELGRPSAFVYIKGHEGRGAGLHGKISAYQYQDQHPLETHIDALHAVGCESDIRMYDAAMKFLKSKLHLKSIKLFTNNPEKIDAAKKHFGANYSCQSMPASPGQHNKKYLKEKEQLCGHKGLCRSYW